MKIISASLLLVLLLINNLAAQTQQKIDPYGYVNKYNASFDGIGPKVYILPWPRTLQEEMTDTFNELLEFKDIVHGGLILAQTLHDFDSTSNQHLYNHIKTTVEINNFIAKSANKKGFADLFNIASKIALENKDTPFALQLLDSALHYAQEASNKLDILSIQSNKAAVLLYDKQYDKALDIENVLVTQYTENSQTIKRARHLTRKALLSALMKDYNTAENTIIRQIIPLYNKAKYPKGKIEAWLTLAFIYQLENKHTEAQWFLIQAKDLAQAAKNEYQLAQINYMMGYSKTIQQNYKVSVKELEEALQMAISVNNPYLQLAILEQLGRSYVHIGKYEEAKSLLLRYNSLKATLFP